MTNRPPGPTRFRIFSACAKTKSEVRLAHTKSYRRRARNGQRWRSPRRRSRRSRTWFFLTLLRAARTASLSQSKAPGAISQLNDSDSPGSPIQFQYLKTIVSPQPAAVLRFVRDKTTWSDDARFQSSVRVRMTTLAVSPSPAPARLDPEMPSVRSVFEVTFPRLGPSCVAEAVDHNPGLARIKTKNPQLFSRSANQRQARGASRAAVSDKPSPGWRPSSHRERSRGPGRKSVPKDRLQPLLLPHLWKWRSAT